MINHKENLIDAINRNDTEDIEYILERDLKIDFTSVVDFICKENLNFSIILLILQDLEKKVNVSAYNYFLITFNTNCTTRVKIFKRVKNLLKKENKEWVGLADGVLNLADGFFRENFLLESFECLKLIGDFYHKEKFNTNVLNFYKLLSLIYLHGNCFIGFLNAIYKCKKLVLETEIDEKSSEFLQKILQLSKIKNDTLDKHAIRTSDFSEIKAFFSNFKGTHINLDECLQHYDANWDLFLENKADLVFTRLNNINDPPKLTISFTNKLFKIKNFYKIAQEPQKLKEITNEKIKQPVETPKITKKVTKKTKKVINSDTFLKNYNLFRLLMKEPKPIISDTYFEIRKKRHLIGFNEYKEHLNSLKTNLSGLNSTVAALFKKLEEKNVVKEEKSVYVPPTPEDSDTKWRKESTPSVYQIPEYIFKPKAEKDIGETKKDGNSTWRK